MSSSYVTIYTSSFVCYYLSSNRRFEKHFCERSRPAGGCGINGVRHSERNCAGRSSRGWVIRSNSAAARRFRLSGRNRSDPPRAARNRTRNGMELRGDVLFANLLIPTREFTGRRGKRVFAKLVASCILRVSFISVQSVLSLSFAV